MLCCVFIKTNSDSFVSNSELKGMNCHYERVSSFGWGEIVDLNEVLDAKPIGFRTKLQYTAIGVKETGIYLSSAENANEFIDSPCYWIRKIDILSWRIKLIQ